MNYQKITKGKARKLFNAGKQIYLHTNKLSWNNPWQNPMPVTKDFEEEKSRIELHQWKINNGYLKNPLTGEDDKLYDSFDLLVNEYSFYNCDNERGNVVIYLISDEVDKDGGYKRKQWKVC